MRHLLLWCCLLLCCASSEAGWRQSYFAAGWYPASPGYAAGYYNGGIYNVYHQDPVVVASFVPIYFYPGAVYQPPQAAPAIPLTPVAPVAPAAPAPAAQAAPGCTEAMKAMETRLKALEAALAQPPQPQVAPKAQAPRDGLAVLVNRCGKCHEEQAAEKGGGGLVLLKGNAPAELSAVQALKIYKQVLSGKMPKGDKLEGNEGSLLMQYLDSVKEKP